ncbi:MAG: radical SAM protein, partial [Methylovirgula sp.]
SVHKHVNRPETFAALVEKVHSYGIMVFGLFMFGFDGDDLSVFDETVKFNTDANYDACAYSVLTPYPGTLTWYEMKKANRMVSYDWTMYDQGHVVYRPAQMSGDQLRIGHARAYENFYSAASMASRFPWHGKRHRGQWAIYNLFMRKAAKTDKIDSIAAPTAEPNVAPMPPLLPVKREWRAAVLEAAGAPDPT